VNGASEGRQSLGTLKGLAECALTLRQLYSVSPCPETLDLLAERMQELRALDVLQVFGASTAAMREELLQSHTLLRWADSGLPAFDLTHGLAAALLLTDPSDVAAELVRLPFSTFAVRMPSGFWVLDGRDGERVEASLCMVHTYRAPTSRSPEQPQPLMCTRIIGRNGSTSTWEIREPLPTAGRIGDWLDDEVPPVIDPTGVVVPPDEEDRRLSISFRRLLVNLCLYIAAHGRGEKLGTRRPGRRCPDARHQPVGPDVWILDRGVKLDPELVESAQAWTDAHDGRRGTGEAWRLRARFTVRGHWRNVAHGPRLSLHRLQWISPFWKGVGPTFAHVYKPEGGVR